MNTDTQEENRSHQRILFDAPIELRGADETSWLSTAIDVSLKGALVKAPANWNGKLGDEYRLRLQLADGELTIEMEAAIAHIENAHIGFHCKHIDLDSITHLRRLVELNLGDEKILHRELAALNQE